MNKDSFLARSFSQDSEDRIVLRLLKHQRNGFFVDIGAHHPYRFSNTALFSELGWTGLNIDATPGAMDAFEAERPQDINVWAAVAAETGHIDFKIFKEPAFNTLNLGRTTPSKEGRDSGEVVRVPAVRIDDLMREKLAADQVVDFVSLDVEGLEETILDTFPFEEFAPRIFIVEDHKINVESCADSDIFKRLKAHGYRLRCQMMFSSIYINEKTI